MGFGDATGVSEMALPPPDGVEKETVNRGQQYGERAFMYQFTEMLGAPSDAAGAMWWGDDGDYPDPGPAPVQPPKPGNLGTPLPDKPHGAGRGNVKNGHRKNAEGSIIDQVESVIPIG